jgi:hypothetical protein
MIANYGALVSQIRHTLSAYLDDGDRCSERRPLGRREILDQQFPKAFLALRVMDERYHGVEGIIRFLTFIQKKSGA